MKTVLATAYAINPYKGSEDAMGWNFVQQIAKYHQVHAVTRKNNKEHIDRYMQENPDPVYSNIQFHYFDLPPYARFWKRGQRGAMLYFYLWQMFLPFFVRKQKIAFDLAHNVNFHNDWTPTFLWSLGKPVVWGPVGHHPAVPRKYILNVYGWKAYLKDRMKWVAKKSFWTLDPFLRVSFKRAARIWVMNSDVERRVKIDNSKVFHWPSVSSEEPAPFIKKDSEYFEVLSVGRFVPLKGFDVTIKAFANFYSRLSSTEKSKVRLTLVGAGEELPRLEKMIKVSGIEKNTRLIQWIERSKLADIYAQSDIFLFPSHEGAGMVVPEALSYGIPVACFDNIGPGEFIDKSCGVKVPYGTYEESIEEFGSQLLILHRDQRLRSELSAGARKRYENIFSWGIKASMLKEIYDSIHGSESKINEKSVRELILKESI